MNKVNIKVKTEFLCPALDKVDCLLPGEFTSDFGSGEVKIRLNGFAVGFTYTPFQPFKITAEQVCRLRDVAGRLVEQTIDLCWDGTALTISEIQI